VLRTQKGVGMLYQIVSYVATLIESWLLFLFLDVCLGRQERPKYIYYGALLVDFLIVAGIGNIAQIIGIAFLISTIYETIAANFIFEGKTRVKVFLVVLYNILLVIVDNLVYILTLGILKVDFTVIYDMNIINTILTVISKTLLCAIIFSLSTLWKRNREKIPLKNMLILYALPIISVCLLLFLFDYSLNVTLDSKRIILLYFTVLGLLIINIFLLFIYNKLDESEQVKYKVLLMEQQIKLQGQYFSELKQSYTRANKLYHDFKNHLLVLSSLTEQNKIKDLKQYLQLLEVELNKNVVISKTNNPVVDAILHEKKYIATKMKIPVSIMAEDFEEGILNPLHLCTLLGNAFDNAIEECERLISEGSYNVYINIKIYKKIDLIFSITNSSHKPQYVNGKIKSSKPDARNHGYGLNNMVYVVKKMNGSSTFGFENNAFTFVARIPLK
jgi:two-component system, LytTR family, sensor histidine kinase AgrC